MRGQSETARPNSALIRDRIDAHGNHPCSKSTRGQPHGRLDRRDSQNLGWRSNCGSLGMKQFFLLESVTATFVTGRDPFNHLTRAFSGGRMILARQLGEAPGYTPGP